MNDEVIVVIEDKDIRFTPDGKIAALDVINALSDQLPAEQLWQEFRRDNPDIVCNEYTFSGDKSLCVIDRPVLERIEEWMFFHMAKTYFPSLRSNGQP